MFSTPTKFRSTSSLALAGFALLLIGAVGATGLIRMFSDDFRGAIALERNNVCCDSRLAIGGIPFRPLSPRKLNTDPDNILISEVELYKRKLICLKHFDEFTDTSHSTESLDGVSAKECRAFYERPPRVVAVAKVTQTYIVNSVESELSLRRDFRMASDSLNRSHASLRALAGAAGTAICESLFAFGAVLLIALQRSQVSRSEFKSWSVCRHGGQVTMVVLGALAFAGGASATFRRLGQGSAYAAELIVWYVDCAAVILAALVPTVIMLWWWLEGRAVRAAT